VEAGKFQRWLGIVDKMASRTRRMEFGESKDAMGRAQINKGEDSEIGKQMGSGETGDSKELESGTTER